MRAPRLIPLTMAMAAVLLAVNIGGLVLGVQNVLISPVVAETAEGKKPAEEAKKEEKPEQESAKKEEGHGEAKKEPVNPSVSEEPGDTTERRFTPVELELLQNLSKRREELDHYESNIQIKEAALDATEKRINEKIDQIEAMRKAVSALLSQYNTQEDAKIKSLVKIYENMKPKDAARIFDEVDMPVLLLVIDQMSEKKVAPILAEMDSKKARQVTMELAEQRKLNTARLDAVSQVAAPAPAANPAPNP